MGLGRDRYSGYCKKSHTHIPKIQIYEHTRTAYQADREIQRTLMELLNQLDGFNSLGSIKIVMATNRPDVLDPALLRCVWGLRGGVAQVIAYKIVYASDIIVDQAK